MALLRYQAQEAANIAAARKEAVRQAKLEASIAKQRADTSIEDLAADLATFQSSMTTALSGKEPTVEAGTSAQYYRGDKSWQTLNKSAVGLGNVDNTADTAKPVSTAQQAALNAKASLTTQQSLATDANATVTPTTSVYQVFHTGTLTTTRTLTLATAGVSSGWIMRFTRTGSGAFNLSVGGLKNLTTNTWCDVVYNGSAWVLTASGSL
jgi:hypothetical protein